MIASLPFRAGPGDATSRCEEIRRSRNEWLRAEVSTLALRPGVATKRGHEKAAGANPGG